MSNTVKTSAEIALLAALITIVGALKIPNIFPCLDFQLSAPLAIAICVVFGFKKYIISGCISSLIGLLLGTQNLLNVFIALEFRVIVGAILWMGKNNLLSIILAGPIASTSARLFLMTFLGKAFSWTLVAMSVPGMLFTAITAPLLVQILKKINKGRGLS